MQNKVVTEIIYETLWFLLAVVVAAIFIYPIYTKISRPFLIYLICSLFLIVTYFRGIVFMQHSIIFRNVWVQLILFVVNVPFMIFVLRQYFSFIHVFDDYNYTLPPTEFQHILAGTEVDDLLYIKSLTIFAGTILLVMIALMEIRIIHAIFKYRQLDKIIHKE
jgi:hypothetical protein